MDRIELISRMLAVDDAVSHAFPGTQFRCVIVGGGALLSLGVITRATLDVDVLNSSPRLIDIFGRYDFNDRVKSLSYCFAERYEDRLVRIDIDTKAVIFYTPCIEDLIVSKLYAYRPKDIDDIERIIQGGKYDRTLLAEVVAEASRSALNDRLYSEMVHLYHHHFK